MFQFFDNKTIITETIESKESIVIYAPNKRVVLKDVNLKTEGNIYIFADEFYTHTDLLFMHGNFIRCDKLILEGGRFSFARTQITANEIIKNVELFENGIEDDHNRVVNDIKMTVPLQKAIDDKEEHWCNFIRLIDKDLRFQKIMVQTELLYKIEELPAHDELNNNNFRP